MVPTGVRQASSGPGTILLLEFAMKMFQNVQETCACLVAKTEENARLVIENARLQAEVAMLQAEHRNKVADLIRNSEPC